MTVRNTDPLTPQEEALMKKIYIVMAIVGIFVVVIFFTYTVAYNKGFDDGVTGRVCTEEGCFSGGYTPDAYDFLKCNRETYTVEEFKNCLQQIKK